MDGSTGKGASEIKTGRNIVNLGRGKEEEGFDASVLGAKMVVVTLLFLRVSPAV